jgi:hypothetical protein
MYSEEEEREFNGSPLRLDADANPPPVRRGLGLTAEDRAWFVWGRHSREDSNGEDREEVHYVPDPDEGMVEAADYVAPALRAPNEAERSAEPVPDTNDAFNDVSDSNDAVDTDGTVEEVPDTEETSDSGSTDTNDEQIEQALDRYHVVNDYIIDPIRHLLSF